MAAQIGPCTQVWCQGLCTRQRPPNLSFLPRPPHRPSHPPTHPPNHPPSAQVEYGIARVEGALPRLCMLAQGGTAVGTGLNAKAGFDVKVGRAWLQIWSKMARMQCLGAGVHEVGLGRERGWVGRKRGSAHRWWDHASLRRVPEVVYMQQHKAQCGRRCRTGMPTGICAPSSPLPPRP